MAAGAGFLGWSCIPVIADLLILKQYSLDIHNIMSGKGMP